MNEQKMNVEAIALKLMVALIENKESVLDSDLEKFARGYALLAKRLKEELAKS